MPKSPKRLLWLLPIGAVVIAIHGFRREEEPQDDRSPGIARADRWPENPSTADASPAIPAEPGHLFTFAAPPDEARLNETLPAPAHAVHYVRVNGALAIGKQSPFWQQPGAGRIEIPLPTGSALTVVIDDSEMQGADRFVSTGRIEGRPASRALFAWSGGFLHASIEDPLLGSFALRAVTKEWSQFYRVAPELVGPCGGERKPSLEPALPRRSAGLYLEPGDTPAPPIRAAAENPQRAEVHVLMLYTQAILPMLSGESRRQALQSAFDLSILKVNTVLEASLVTARVKLVAIAETRVDGDEVSQARSGWQDDALTALYLEEDGQMDEIHALRDQAGADVVCLALQRRDTASSGLSFLLDQPEDPENSRFAFSVVQYSAIAGTNVVPHELGHVFGCAHDRRNALSGPGAFSFSYGYNFVGADGRQYFDIMSYPPSIGATELSYFSNPAIVLPPPIGARLGVPAGQPGESNIALTIERTAFTTACYRLQTQAAASAGTLINVATRAYVGTGEEVLIGGFVVQGSQPKQMLIRGAGPSLASFGVLEALQDPVLRVFNAGTLLAENDNWGVPLGAGAASAAEVAASAAAAQAFAFDAGSADAAVLITLPPGAYTAVVEGARGTRGSGLVEAYDVSAGGARIVNLATRGYAARDGREMVGGFVVQGQPGSTKRILVRVLGPTLGRAPFYLTGTLDDPEMEIRNGAGELLIKNDDWSSGAEGGASPENDFKPIVELYGEKQISATGLAPKNRREPCVLVDLPPGNYTVIVRPYELRSPNPLLDQPALPGVGIVEVYEIER